MITLPLADLAIPSAIVFGLFGIMPAGVLVAMIGRAVAAERRAFGMGVYYIGYFFFCTVSPIMAGWLFDQTGDARDPLLLAMALFALTAASYWAFEVAEKRL
jgi:MFS family permease